ncbi:MAG: hypothetical protein C5B59_04150 [Bacteroidetes bacterium]|nr:MAG: hypothetical protein C5B59_04150 [Bacteroidota bacterium]
MKRILMLICLLNISALAVCQPNGNYQGDVDKAFGYIKKAAFKHGYHYMITFGEVNAAAINVTPNTSYLIFFVYDNSQHLAPNFKAFLMTPDSALREKYTAKPFDRAQVGMARVAQMDFRTQTLNQSKTRPVKLEASPKATIYVFTKK